MTAVALFDALSREAAAPGAAPAATQRQQFLARFAARLVAAQLSDLERLAEYERQFASTPRSHPARELEVRQTIWQLFSQWADEADGVLSRARLVSTGGAPVEGSDRLDGAIGRVRARLSVPPEQTARAVEDARQGRAVPAKELRDELHARLRA